MRWLLLLLLAWPLTLFGAAGDITGVAIETNGWQVLVYVNGLATNGTYASFGFGTNNTITGNEKLTVNLTSQGYDDTGTATTVPRRVYGTLRVRFPYPSDAFADTLVVGSDVRLRIALSDWVYAGDSNITANISAGLYTQGTANSAGTGLTVTNLSTQPYPKAIANWSWPGWNRETGSTMRLRAVGFHSSARNGSPLALMRFIATDESGDSVTSNQTDMQIDRTLPDLIPTGEYYADISQSTFASLDRIRCDFVAFPWIGDTNSVLSTTTDSYSQPTPLPASITNLCDRLNVYTDAIAVVAVGGNDTNGQITNVAPASVDSAHYFASIAGAVTKSAAYNNSNFAHNDAGGAIIYVKNGIVNWTGAAHAVTTVPRAWTTVKNYPGDTVTLTGDTGTDDIADRVKIQGINFEFAGAAVPWSSIGALWFDGGCVFNSTGTAPLQNCPAVYLTHSYVTNFTQGLRAFSSQNTAFSLIRGNNLDGYNSSTIFFTMLGNTHPSTNGGAYVVNSSASTFGAPGPDYQILYNNTLFGFTGNATCAALAESKTLTNGMAVIQNVFEYCTNNSGPNIIFMASQNTLQATNLLFWNNNVVGKRAGFLYNDSGSAAAYKIMTGSLNNIADVPGFKSDTFTTPNGARIGNWSVIWGSGWQGNVWVHCSVDTGAGSFHQEFGGLSTSDTATGETNIVNYPQYVNRLAWDGANTTAGGGNYKTLSSAPQLALQSKWVLPFDLDGNYRGLSDPPGAYASAVPRKSAGFFAP